MAGWGLVVGVPALVLGLLGLSLWALRGLWGATRPPEAEVVAQPRRRAA